MKSNQMAARDARLAKESAWTTDLAGMFLLLATIAIPLFPIVVVLAIPVGLAIWVYAVLLRRHVVHEEAEERKLALAREEPFDWHPSKHLPNPGH